MNGVSTASGVVTRFAVLLLMPVVVGCSWLTSVTPSRILGPGEQWLPAVAASGCFGVDLVGERLHGSPGDPRLVWMENKHGDRTDLIWPIGYSARFDPRLEVIDDRGQVVGTDGTSVRGGCVTADPNVMFVILHSSDTSPNPTSS